MIQVTEKQEINIDNQLEKLLEFNSTEREFRNDITIHQLFEEQVSLKGSEIAVLCEHEKSFQRRCK